MLATESHAPAPPTTSLSVWVTRCSGTRTTTLAETDYQTLRAMLREAETALAASTGAHAGRLAKYVRRPKV